MVRRKGKGKQGKGKQRLRELASMANGKSGGRGGGGGGLVVARRPVKSGAGAGAGAFSGAGITNAALLAAASTSKRVGPFKRGDRVLFVGEGDFSFSQAVAAGIGGASVAASSLDSFHDVVTKYPSARPTLRGLATMGASVRHGVDATSLTPDDLDWILEACHPRPGFTHIVFNFPHVGGGSTEADVKANQKMLTRFFRQVRPLLHDADPAGQVMVTLRKNVFYDSWKIDDLAQQSGYELFSLTPFRQSQYAAYEPVRTTPRVRAAPEGQALVHAFVSDGRPDTKLPPLEMSEDEEDDDDEEEGSEEEKQDSEEEEEEESEEEEAIPRIPETKKRSKQPQPKAKKRARVAPPEAAAPKPAAAPSPTTDLFCAVCSESFPTASRLTLHKASPWHKRKADKLSKKKQKK